MKLATVLTATAGAAFALLVVAGFLALDMTVLHVVTDEDEPEVSREEESSPTPGSEFSKEEVITIAENRISLGECRTGATEWEAAYKGDGVWHIGVSCGRAMPLTNPDLAQYPVWSFRKLLNELSRSNDQARDFFVR